MIEAVTSRLCNGQLLAEKYSWIVAPRQTCGHGRCAGSGRGSAVRNQELLRWRLVTKFPKSSTPSLAGPRNCQSLQLMSGSQIESARALCGRADACFWRDGDCRTARSSGFDRSPTISPTKDYCFALGCAVPFGLTARQMNAWMEYGGGRRKLMDDFTPVQHQSLRRRQYQHADGGWCRKIKTVQDLAWSAHEAGGGLLGDALQNERAGRQHAIADAQQALGKRTASICGKFVGPMTTSWTSADRALLLLSGW